MPPPAAFQDNHEYPDLKYSWTALTLVMIALFMVVLDSNIVNVALPHMMSTYSTNTDRIRWVVESYSISYAIFTLTTTWLRERAGIKNTILIGIALFTSASALCGIAWSVESMILFRILQGLGGGIMMPAGFTIITESFPPHKRATAFGVFGLVIVVAPSVGPTLGGYLVDAVNWRYIFYINLPIGILCFILSAAILKELKKLLPHKFDFFGFASLSIFLGSLLLALTEGQQKGWRSDFILSLFAVAAIGLALFIIIDSRVKSPIIALDLFRNFHFAILSILNLLRSIALFGRMFLLPLFFQSLIGYSATMTGLLLAPGAIVAGIVMPLSGALIDRYGPKFFIFSGFIIFAVSNIMFYNLNVTSPYSAILLPMILYGAGAGLLNTPITATAMNVVKRQHISQVSTVLSVLMQVGGAFGIALLGTALNTRAAFHQAVYAEKITPWSYATQNALNGAKSLGARIGQSSFLSDLQAPALISMSVSKQAIIAAYQDAFVYTGLACLIALIPALGLLTLKHQRGPKGPGARAPAGE